MCFTTKDYATETVRLAYQWVAQYPPIQFVLAMEIIFRAAGVQLPQGQSLPPFVFFMNDLTLLTSETSAAEAILQKLLELTGWECLKFKAKKSRSLVLKRGKLVSDCLLARGWRNTIRASRTIHKFEEMIHTRLDTKHVAEVKSQLEKGLSAIDKCGLQEKYKLWCLQLGLLSKLMNEWMLNCTSALQAIQLMWPLMIYEVISNDTCRSNVEGSVWCARSGSVWQRAFLP